MSGMGHSKNPNLHRRKETKDFRGKQKYLVGGPAFLKRKRVNETW